MSGGSLDYFYLRLEEHNKDLGDKELNELVSDLAELFHDREWYLSGDTGIGDWNEAKDIFKAKWFTEHGRQERIEKYLVEFADEIRETFGLNKKYCENCKYWERKGERYGNCEFHKCCLMHKKEKCEKWEEKE